MENKICRVSSKTISFKYGFLVLPVSVYNFRFCLFMNFFAGNNSDSHATSRSERRQQKKSGSNNACTCLDPFSLEICPKHPDSSKLSGYRVVTIERTGSLKEIPGSRVFKGPPCKCGERYMSQNFLQTGNKKSAILIDRKLVPCKSQILYVRKNDKNGTIKKTFSFDPIFL